jgi:hypothetical protein
MKVQVSVQSLEALCRLITAKPYRTGPQLIAFFNPFGWSDVYGQIVFPSRWKYAEEKLNVLNNSDRIVDCIEQAIDPRNFLNTNENVEQIVQDINQYFQHDGLELYKSGLTYKVKRVRGSRFGEDVKNIIFASNGPKPDIVLQDALSNKISIVRNAEFCLVYDREVSEDGLFWTDLVDWWSEKTGKPANPDLERELYSRLFVAVPDTSPPAKLLFKTYYKFKKKMSSGFPVLLPEVYLHFDPKTLQERGGIGVLINQRMDFLLLLPNGTRIVIEVDGKQHYATNDRADPKLYGNLMYGNRELQILGYEVYRFGAQELQGLDADKLVEEFFTKLFKRYMPNLS